MLTTSVLPNPTLTLPIATQVAALFYDLDGTLANTDPMHYRAWWEMLQDFDIEVDEAFYKTRISGRLNPAIVADLLPQLSPSDAVQFIEQKEARFRELAPQLSRMAGLSEVLDWASNQRLKQAVVTNAPPENTHHMLKALNLDTTFDHVVLAEVLGIGKPDPAPYQHALQQFGLTPDRVIAFEDSPSGIRAAGGAGIPTIGIASTQDPAVLYAVGASLVVPDFTAAELWAVLTGESRTAES